MDIKYWKGQTLPELRQRMLLSEIWPNRLVLIFLLIAILASLYVCYQQFWSPLAGIPGPFVASLSRLWLVRQSRAGNMHRTMVALHRKYGHSVRIGPNEISITNPEEIKKIYGAGTKFRKSSWYSVFQGHRKFDLFAERNELIHGQQRRLVSRIYSAETLKEFEPYVAEAVSHFMLKMEGMQGQAVDLGNWLQLFAFDVIGEITFSQRFGFMDAENDDGIFTQIKSVLHSGSWLGQIPWLYWICDFLQPVTGNYLGVNARHGKIRDYTMREVHNRQERGGDRRDILSRLFDVQKDKPSEMSIVDVVSMAASNINAGSDTTAISLRAVIYYLLKNPECKAKFLNEVDSVMSAEHSSEVVTLDQSRKMPYLQACLYEALRLHPAVGMNLPRTTPPGGTMIGQYFIPEKTIVGANPWAVHYSKDIFGHDADLFRPERWLEDKTGDLNRFFFAFGSGARMCLGRNISWMEMSKFIPTLFRRFELELIDPSAALKESCNFFVMQSGLLITLSPRKCV